MTEDLVDPGAFDRCRLGSPARLAGRDPAEAARVLDSLRDPRVAGPGPPRALPRHGPDRPRSGPPPDRPGPPRRPLPARLCLGDDGPGRRRRRQAGGDRLAPRGVRPARPIAPIRPDAAGASHDPASVAAALLPVAERIDPKLVPELFWRAVSLHAPTAVAETRSEAVFAMLLARYDRAVALTFFEPLAVGPRHSPRPTSSPWSPPPRSSTRPRRPAGRRPARSPRPHLPPPQERGPARPRRRPRPTRPRLLGRRHLPVPPPLG